MAFNKYLKKLAAHPVIRTSEDLRVFLQAQGNLPLAKTKTVASRMMSPPRGENLDSSIYANLANDSVIGRKESWFSSIKKTLSRSSKEKKTQERIRGGKSFCMIPGGPHLIQEIEGSMVWLSDVRGIWTVSWGYSKNLDTQKKLFINSNHFTNALSNSHREGKRTIHFLTHHHTHKNISLISEQVSLILRQIDSSQKKLAQMEKQLLGYESIDLSTPNMPNELKLFLQRNQLPLGKDSRTGRERLTGSRGIPQFQGRVPVEFHSEKEPLIILQLINNSISADCWSGFHLRRLLVRLSSPQGKPPFVLPKSRNYIPHFVLMLKFWWSDILIEIEVFAHLWLKLNVATSLLKSASFVNLPPRICESCGSQYTLTMVDSQFAFEPPSDEFIKKQEPSLSFQSVEINEYANNPETLLLEAIHSGGYSGALANPLLASECSLNRLNSSILEEFVAILDEKLGWQVIYYIKKPKILMGRATEDVIVDVDLGREGDCRISRRQSISTVKPLWRAAECWKENLKLLNIAETAIQTKESSFKNGELAQSSYGFIARTRGILRPAVSLKNIMNDFVWPVSSWNLKDLM
ncbi:hypothetical protein L2E82_36139 [Cichorium intybus]|uniref:Uncharacterized protein n=1 Tax=Cichorium intybus TaxID=13427 RepID=A0ACB9BQP2_CICIN|nr:hypothetical protein L2E82_36139 [Cichorium intybus]